MLRRHVSPHDKGAKHSEARTTTHHILLSEDIKKIDEQESSDLSPFRIVLSDRKALAIHRGAALRAARLKDFPLLLEIPSAGRVARGRSNCAAKLHRAGDPGAAPEGQATRSEGAEGWSTI